MPGYHSEWLHNLRPQNWVEDCSLSDTSTNNRINLFFILYDMISQHFFSYFFIWGSLSINFCVNFPFISLFPFSYWSIHLLPYWIDRLQYDLKIEIPLTGMLQIHFLPWTFFVNDIFDHIRVCFLYFSFVLFWPYVVWVLNLFFLLFLSRVSGLWRPFPSQYYRNIVLNFILVNYSFIFYTENL